jgi:hypothetical protein
MHRRDARAGTREALHNNQHLHTHTHWHEWRKMKSCCRIRRLSLVKKLQQLLNSAEQSEVWNLRAPSYSRRDVCGMFEWHKVKYKALNSVRIIQATGERRDINSNKHWKLMQQKRSQIQRTSEREQDLNTSPLLREWTDNNTNILLSDDEKNIKGGIPSLYWYYRGYTIEITLVINCRSQWPCGLKHKLSSPTKTLESWVRVRLEAWMSVCVYSVFVLSCVCR